MKHSSTSQLPIKISDPVRKSLAAYAVGAAAAGVSLLSLTPAAEAEIVYTPANVRITPHQKIDIDLNHDGTFDFQLADNCYNSSLSGCILTVSPKDPSGGAGVHGRIDGANAAAALSKGVLISSAHNFDNLFAIMAVAYSHQSGGPWANVNERYLGLQFSVNGELHYGWARLSVIANKSSDQLAAQLTGFAYESVPNQAIRAGQMVGTEDNATSVPPQASLFSAKLGLLAMGSSGLALWRRDEIAG